MELDFRSKDKLKLTLIVKNKKFALWVIRHKKDLELQSQSVSISVDFRLKFTVNVVFSIKMVKGLIFDEKIHLKSIDFQHKLNHLRNCRQILQNGWRWPKSEWAC